MSSAVVLDCRDCHTRAHQVTLAELGNPSATCNACHGAVHQAQQRLVLGEVPGMPAQPAMKFAAGLVCRSCHAAPGADSGQPLRGQTSACVGCHRPEYARIAGWWVTGSRVRAQAVEAYVREASASLGTGAPDSAHKLLEGTLQDLAIVRQGGGQHNVELSYAIFRESIARARSAYQLTGRAAPPAPAIGLPPRVGMCSYCHYSTNEQWDFKRMPADFHRQVMDTARITAAESPAH
jgi:predicted CXXCH cytochrome family protein